MQIFYKLLLIGTLFLIFQSCSPYKICTESFLYDYSEVKENAKENAKENGKENDKEIGKENSKYSEQSEQSESLTCEDLIYENKEQSVHHWLYGIIPRHRCQLYWYDVGHWTTWMLFGNDDDGIFGEEATAKFRMNWPVGPCKALAWSVRNPLHNFCFYVIGTAYCRNSEFTILKLTPCHVCFCRYKEQGYNVFGAKDTSFYLGLHGWKPFVSLRLCYNQRCKSDFYVGWRCRGNFGIKCILLGKRKCQKKSNLGENKQVCNFY